MTRSSGIAKQQKTGNQHLNNFDWYVHWNDMYNCQEEDKKSDFVMKQPEWNVHEIHSPGQRMVWDAFSSGQRDGRL